MQSCTHCPHHCPGGSDRQPSQLNPPRTFIDTAEDCAICLTPLSSEPCLTLRCGHIWHLDCLKEQLEHARPNPTKRLLFTGCRCAKCGKVCEHEELDSVTRPVFALQEKVDQLILSQAAVDGLTAPTQEALLDQGHRQYAFFLCSVCEEPYFGGTVECADEPNADVAPADRTCTMCTPRAAATCTNSEHRGHYVWKCRYCCSVAKFVCYGSTHFCEACHARNSARREGERLAAIPCSGSCSIPLLDSAERHANGAGPENEQVLWCAWCRSDPTGSTALSRLELGSRNMVFNPCGEHDTRGWTTMPGCQSWSTETCDFPFLNNRTNFVSSHQWAGMAQVVNLRRFVRRPEQSFIEVSARYMARWDCPSHFRFEAALYDSQLNLLREHKSDILDAPADYWDEAKHVFELTEGVHYAVLVVFGKDGRMWAGEYGAKVANCCVRVRYDDAVENENEVVVLEAFENIREDNSPECRNAMRNVQRNFRARLGPRRRYHHYRPQLFEPHGFYP